MFGQTTSGPQCKYCGEELYSILAGLNENMLGLDWGESKQEFWVTSLFLAPSGWCDAQVFTPSVRCMHEFVQTQEQQVLEVAVKAQMNLYAAISSHSGNALSVQL